MAKTKTTETQNSVQGFVSQVEDEAKRKDSNVLLELLEKETGFNPKMWGSSIIGFGSYHYKYASGHEGDAPLVGFSPRKNAIVLYLACDFDGKETLIDKLGKFKAGKGCIYIKKLSDVDIPVLKEMVKASIQHTGQLYK